MLAKSLLIPDICVFHHLRDLSVETTHTDLHFSLHIVWGGGGVWKRGGGGGGGGGSRRNGNMLSSVK